MRCKKLITKVSEAAQREVVKGISFSFEPEKEYLYIASQKTSKDVVVARSGKGFKVFVSANKEFNTKDAKEAALSAAAHIDMRNSSKVIQNAINKYYK